MVGMGYVGIPLACLLARSGCEVTGIDIAPARVDLLNRGVYPLKGEEPDLPELLADQVESGLLRGSTDFSCCRDANAVFICVDTPIDDEKKPIFDRLLDAVEQIGLNISKNTLVVVESTIAPGTMTERVQPLLERCSGLKAGEGMLLAHCPERVMSGKLLHNLKKLDRVLGSFDDRSAEAAIHWYSKIMEGEIHRTDMTSAEIVKTTENAYRDVQIAFANEIGLICEKLGLNAFEIRDLVNTCPYRNMHIPGAGVGGHCLPKDPWLLIYGGRDAKPELLPMARRINDMMAEHTANIAGEAIAECGLDADKSTRIVIFGIAFLENAGDYRNSPSLVVIDRLKDRYEVVAHDPHVEQVEGMGIDIIRDLDEALSLADCAIFMTKHREYLELSLEHIARSMRHKILIDGRNLFDKIEAESLGIRYRGIGKG